MTTSTSTTKQNPTEVTVDPSTLKKVMVCGELIRRNDHFVEERLDQLNSEIDIGLVIHDGGSSRVGILTGKWATKNNIPQIIFPIWWANKGKADISERNQRMLAAKPDVAVVFSGGQGNDDMVKRVKKVKMRLWSPL
jgi:hypothetical protein